MIILYNLNFPLIHNPVKKKRRRRRSIRRRKRRGKRSRRRGEEEEKERGQNMHNEVINYDAN